jgi:protein-disulfide isomerase
MKNTDVTAVRLPLTSGMLIVAFIGLFAAGVLGTAHVLDLPIPCGRSGGCATVALHPSSRLLGIPIALFGAGAYLTILFLLGRATLTRRVRFAFTGLAGTGTIISAGLLLYAHTVIRATCPWCLVSGAAMTLLFISALLLLRHREPVAGPRPAWVWSLAFVTAVALGVQAGVMKKQSVAPPVSARLLAKYNDTHLVDPAKSLGPATAPVTIIEFADLCCWACQMSYDSLLKYQQANPAGVRLVLRHVPLWQIRGHRFSRAAAAVGEMMAEEGRFWPFVAEVFPRHNQITRDLLLEVVKKLGADPQQIESRLADANDPAIARVLRDEALAEELGIHQTPTFIVLIAGQQPISATQRTLSQLLNSPLVMSLVAEAAANAARSGTAQLE